MQNLSYAKADKKPSWSDDIEELKEQNLFSRYTRR